MSYSGIISPPPALLRRSLTLKPTNCPVAPAVASLKRDVRALDSLEDKSPYEMSSAELIEYEKKYLVRTYKRAPMVPSSGEGCKLYDVEGREYLDLTSGIGVNALGHGDPDCLRAITEQYKKLAHAGNIFSTIPPMVFAARLVKNSFADRVFFCNSGTEANEAAIKFSKKFQRFSRPDVENPPTEFIAFSNSFHGRTTGSLALTSKEEYRAPFEPGMPGVTFLEYGDTKAAVELIQSGKFAAVFVEPLQGEGGIYTAEKTFFESLRAACDDAGCLLVFDEVQCGLGRTGHLWAHEAFGVYPDIMTLAKPLAGGLAIGAVLVTKRVDSAIEYGDHGSTFGGNPVACNTAIVVFDKISNPDFLLSVTEKGHYFKKLLLEKIGSNPHVREIRGLGLILGVDLDVKAGPLVDACLKAGLLVLTAGKGNVVRILPPLIISKEEVDEAVEILASCFPVLDQVVSN